MLYDPKWEVQTRPDVFSLESLIAWLEKMPARKGYDFLCYGHCLLAQFAKSIDPNMSEPPGENAYAYIINGETVDLSDFRRIACDTNGRGETFGAALERARAAL